MFSSQVDWRFATGRTDLGQPATAIHPWAFEYPLPPNTARVRMVQESTVSADMVDLGPRPFEEGTSVIGGNLVRVVRCDVMPAVLTYTIEIIDPTMWDGGFISCFTMQLAAEISLPITGSGAMAREMAQMAQAAISSQIGPNQTQSVTSVPQGESRTTRGRG